MGSSVPLVTRQQEQSNGRSVKESSGLGQDGREQEQEDVALLGQGQEHGMAAEVAR